MPATPSIAGSLLTSVLGVYARQGELSNVDLYKTLAGAGIVSEESLSEKSAIGANQALHSPLRRQIRWYQQTLKQLGLIERVTGSRGVWRAVAGITDDKALTPVTAGVTLVAFSTKLGLAIWGDCRKVFTDLNEPIHLCLTSPPYCLAKARAYGGPTEREYVDFICEAMEPIVRNLVPGGSLCLNVSNDIFVSGSPARSMYRERMVLALHDRLGLHKMDELIWLNPSKAPGPIAWASKKRVQLNVAYEPIYWFTNDPHQVRSNNQRVLQPHTEAHLKLIAAGGETRTSSFGDGANRVRPGSFGNATAGKIPRNVITVGHRCAKQTPARNAARDAGLPVHGAAMPFAVADFLVKFLSEPDDLVVDPFAGYFTTAQAAEDSGRRWLSTDLNHEYAYAGSFRFETNEGFSRELAL